MTLSHSIATYYRCPHPVFVLVDALSEDTGYFRFTDEVLCYGRSSAGFRRPQPFGDLYDTTIHASANGALALPFDPDEVVDNLRLEKYAAEYRPDSYRKGVNRFLSSAYYLVRPWLNVSVRQYLQRARLSGWEKRTFPSWPVDTTVDDLMDRLLLLLGRQSGRPVPFIWFWPDRASGCVVLTHDIESLAGYKFSSTLMDLDERFGFRASFQVVPEERYKVDETFLREIRDRGFEVNVHDLNHDGNLFRDRCTFLKRLPAIQGHSIEFGARGFRSGSMYRNPRWIEELGFEYDMSIPNAARLDPQPGGCCTVFPYFIGNMLELPTTTVQDYPLFHILRERSIDLWRMQLDLILKKHGMASFIVHPDYILGKAERDVYIRLLEHLQRSRDESNLWVAKPAEVNDWWRARDAMQLVQKDGRWTIEGPQSGRAQIAFAHCEGDQTRFELAS